MMHFTANGGSSGDVTEFDKSK